MRNKRKIISWLLILVFALGLPMYAFADEAESSAGEEDEKTVYIETVYIRSEKDLRELAENCKLDTWSTGKRVVLKNDISLDEADFEPIPSFAGLFDGNGHTISGLRIDGSITPAGLFGRLQATGIIRNLTVSGTVMPTGDAEYVGGIVGENYGLITACTFTGNVIGASNTGGVTGINGLSGRISDCEVSGAVVGADMTGGIVGGNLGITAESTNKACVNTVSVDPTVDPSDINFDFLTDVSKLTSLDTRSAATDTGGIAGYSAGILKECSNKAAVGYPHIGYNVGGIAGRSCGYVYGCTNAAEIYGRKDVGGIVGQMEPYIAKYLTESTVVQLQRQLDELDALVEVTIQHADGISGAVTSRLNSIAGSIGSAASAATDIVSGAIAGSGVGGESGNVSDTIDGLVSGGFGGESGWGDGSLDVQTQINISNNMAGLSSALYGMAGQMSLLGGEIGGASAELRADVEAIRAKINEITQMGFDLILNDDENDVLVDSSEIDIELITLGKVADCDNTATVNGDKNVGGIAGCMAMEYSLDPEDDITVSIDNSTRKKYEVKAVIQQCKNIGAIESKRNYVGGIVGKMDLGLIAQCEAYGNVSSENGSYAGGIVGLCSSTVRQCFAKCSLSGEKYVGGIVGSGVREDKTGDSSIVAGCYAIVTVSDCRQYAGAISGAYAGTFLENYFVSESLAGINRMNYSDCAQPLSYTELLTRFERPQEAESAENGQTEELPDEFRKFNLKFVVDGETVYSEVFDYGASFSNDIFPELPEKNGCIARWDRTELNNLCFDTTVTAVYEPYISVLYCDDVRDDGRPIFFAEGNFGDYDTLRIELLPVAYEAFDPDGGVEDIIRKSLDNLSAKAEIVEQWQLQLSADSSSAHTFRYLPPEEAAERMDIYIEQNGAWHKAETKVIGSYVAFEAEGNNIQIAAVRGGSGEMILLVSAVILTAAFLFAFLIGKCLKRGGKHIQAAIAAGRSEKDRNSDFPSHAKKQKRRRLTVLLLLLALLLVLLGIAAYSFLPDLIAGKGAYEVISAFVANKETAMELNSEVTLGTESYPLSAHIERTMYEGQSIVSVSSRGITLYYCDGAVFMANGAAYQVSEEIPDYSQLLERALEIYKLTETEAVDGVYSITATAFEAKEILKLLCPSMADYLPDTDSVQLCLYTEDKKLPMLTFHGSGRLNDENATPYDINATLTLAEKAEQDIPTEVLNAIANGEYKSALSLTDDFLRLLTAWQSLNDADLLCAEIAFCVDCGVLDAEESLQLYRWNISDVQIYSVQKNGFGLYFTKDTICDANGISVSAANASSLDTARLLDVLYTLCVNTSARCDTDGERYTYTLFIDADGMAEVVCALAPETEKMDIKFETGSVSILVEHDELRHIDVSIGGSVQLVLSSAKASIGATMDFISNENAAALPDAVISALVK